MIAKRLLAAAMLALSVGAAACTAEVEKEGTAPDVDVEGGSLPKVDVDPANVEVGQDTQQVITPDVQVTPTEGDDK